MKLKIFALLICTVLVGLPNFLKAQSFFKPIPKPHSTLFTQRLGLSAPGELVRVNALRPILNIAAYAEPGHKLMAGAGVAYEWLTWNETSGKYDCPFSISGMMWAGGSVAPKTPSEAVDFGVMVGFMNNLITVGVIPPLTGKQWQATIGVGISLNN